MHKHKHKAGSGNESSVAIVVTVKRGTKAAIVIYALEQLKHCC